MNLRDYLEQRERELLDELGSLYTKITPREAELAEIRRAKVAIGMTNELGAGGIGLFGASFGSLGGLTALTGGLGAALAGSSLSNALTAPSGSNLDGLSGIAASIAALHASPYAHLTMKQLVVKVLSEHFENGATARQMLEFFRDAWGRDIERQNLSPQLTRLYQEGVLGRGTNGIWFLLEGRLFQPGDHHIAAPISTEEE